MLKLKLKVKTLFLTLYLHIKIIKVNAFKECVNHGLKITLNTEQKLQSTMLGVE